MITVTHESKPQGQPLTALTPNGHYVPVANGALVFVTIYKGMFSAVYVDGSVSAGYQPPLSDLFRPCAVEIKTILL